MFAKKESPKSSRNPKAQKKGDLQTVKNTFSFAISADCSWLTAFFENLDLEAASASSCKDLYMVCTISSKNRSAPCLAKKDTDTGQLS